MYKIYIIYLSLFFSFGPTARAQGDSAGLITISLKNLNITIDANTGSRIVSLQFDGQEVLSSKKINTHFFGSTLWLSPEGKWKGQGVLDNGKYSLALEGGKYLKLNSKRDSICGFSFTKEFHANLIDTSIEINYTIRNISKKDQMVAPWEVTRVPTGGLVFIPKGPPGNIPTANKVYPLLNIRDTIGTIWYQYDSSTLSPQKLFMNGSEGWTAYVYKRIIFIKAYPIINPEKAAPGERNVEVYVNQPKTYMELENQGDYRTLTPNGSLTYTVKWYVRQLPDNIQQEIGNKELVEFARNIIN